MNILPLDLFPINVLSVSDVLTEQQTNDLQEAAHIVFNGVPDELSFLQSTPNFDKEEVAQPLVQAIKQAVSEYCLPRGHIPNNSYISSMWFNRYNNHGKIHKHIHSNSYLSGVYYLTNDGATTFYDPLDKIKHVISPTIAYMTDHSSSIKYIESKRNTMVLFPSWIEHDSTLCEGTRYTIAFNVMFSQLGDDLMLNKLNTFR